MFAALLFPAALAETLRLPPGEDAAVWKAAAEAAGLQLEPEPGLILVHEGNTWFLVRPEDPTTRFPIPAPDSPERRAAVLELAARVLAGPRPPPSGIVPVGRDPAEPYAIEHTAPTEPTPAEAAELAAEQVLLLPAPKPPQGPPRPVPPPLPWPSGWIVGVEPGFELVAAEPRPHVAVIGGVRTSGRWLFGLVVEAGPPMPVAETGATIERDSVRAEVGYRFLVLSAGIGRAELVSGDSVRGELLFPVVSAELERPFVVGPLVLAPRVAMEGTLAQMRFAWRDDLYEPGMFSLNLGLRVEAPVARPP